MPLSEDADPVVRVVHELQAECVNFKLAYRRLVRLTVAGFVVLVLAFGASLYLRSSDLERLTNAGNRETVRECFRSANQRPQFRRLLRDPALEDAVKNLVHAAYVRAPSLAECRNLAKQFHLSSEE